ncbi:MAG: DNA repair protein RecN [Gammaproteobacteria bacterium]
MGLKHLSVKNYAIVDQLDLEFSNGMTVFTGETGAGKSIMIDALGLVLGDRAQSGVVRTGADKTSISAIFDISALPKAKILLEDQDIDIEEGECLLRRQISSDGRSRAYINGVAVPVQTLKTLSEFLIDIHGQHAHQSLTRKDNQREMLDEFAGHDALIEAVQKSAENWKTITKDLESLSGDPKERDSQKDLLRYQIDELQTIIVDPEALIATLDHHKKLANQTRISDACQTAENIFHDQESQSSRLQKAIVALQEVSQFEPKVESIIETMNEASIQLDEAETQLRHLIRSLDFDQNEFDQIELRLSSLQDLARKHQTQIEDLPATFSTLKNQLNGLENSEQRFKQLLADQNQAFSDYQQAAEKLSKSRKNQAKKLSDQISKEMQLLGMAGGKFEVHLENKNEENLSSTGIDQIEFMVSANPGQAIQSLSKVASGGELSRISLAIQVITAQGKGVPTLVFDEVDVGIGGGIAEIVGKKMRALGEKRQILCVTHLPQVASLGHHHFQVKKDSDQNNTWTEIIPLDQKQRVNEIARMLGGLKITDQTLAHAEEMLTGY